ncbi:MAG: CoA-binding protein [Acidobacteria bacterium]|nr:CoA-binding protein [Acidobacteriota bacterium]
MTDSEIRTLLAEAKTIAVVGLSSKPHRSSHEIAQYMQRHGYRIIPVNPRETEVLGEKAYPTLAAVPVPIDIVNVFRNSEDVAALTEDVLALTAKPRAYWLQVGVHHAESEARAEAAGIPTISNACLMVLHKLMGPA